MVAQLLSLVFYYISIFYVYVSPLADTALVVPQLDHNPQLGVILGHYVTNFTLFSFHSPTSIQDLEVLPPTVPELGVSLLGPPQVSWSVTGF